MTSAGNLKVFQKSLRVLFCAPHQLMSSSGLRLRQSQINVFVEALTREETF